MTPAKPKTKGKSDYIKKPRRAWAPDDVSLFGAVSSLQLLVADAYNTAAEKGWHDKYTSVGDKLALMHSEVSEALEEFRQTGDVQKVYFRHPQFGLVDSLKETAKFSEGTHGKPWKPEGLPVELADVLIRIFDFCGRYSVDISTAVRLKLEYNKHRSYRHGGKRL